MRGGAAVAALLALVALSSGGLALIAAHTAWPIFTVRAAASQPESAALTLHLVPLADEAAAIPAAEDIVHYRGQRYLASASYAHPIALVGEEACPPCEEAEEEFLRPPDPAFYIDVLIVIFCISTAGLMAGCTMGILSIDPLTLRLKQMEGSADDRRCAEAVLPVLSAHHDLLVTLLLCNAAANEALPIFLDRLVDPATAVLLSVTCVLIFGEILPSAVMTGPAQLQIAAALAPGVRVLMLLAAPIAWPMARLLDHVLGHHDGVTRFKRNEFKALVKMQARTKGWHRRTTTSAKSEIAAALPAAGASPSPTAASTPTRTPAQLRRQLSDVIEKTRAEKRPDVKLAAGQKPGGPMRQQSVSHGHGGHGEELNDEFTEDEVTILTSVFSLQSKRVADLIETGRNDFEHVRMIGEHETMDLATMQLITQWGVSRLPIYRGRRTNIRGLILVKQQIALDPDDCTPVADLPVRHPILMHPHLSMFDALNRFQTGRSHLAFITPHAKDIWQSWRDGSDVPSHVEILGVCTIEDVIEELIGEEGACVRAASFPTESLLATLCLANTCPSNRDRQCSTRQIRPNLRPRCARSATCWTRGLPNAATTAFIQRLMPPPVVA